jgi:hypothetical protein
VGWPKVAWNQCILWPGPCHPRAVLSQALSFGWCRPKLTAAISMIHPSHRRWSGPRALGQWQSTVNSRANHLDRKATAPFTAVPAAASGTFNPLCKVLCILQSLYLCAIGLEPVFVLAMDTPRTSNCSPKPLYSWIQTAAPQMTTTHGGCTGQYPSLVDHSRSLPGAMATQGSCRLLHSPQNVF